MMKPPEDWQEDFNESTKGRWLIGASDVTALLGINPWKSPIQVFCKCTGRPVPGYKPFGEGREAQRGINKEKQLRKIFEHRHGVKLESGVLLKLTDRRYGVQMDGFNESGIYVEAKSPGYHKRGLYGKAGTGQVEPQNYVASQWGLYVLREAFGKDFEQCHFMVSFSWSEYDFSYLPFDVKTNENMQRRLLSMVEHFLHYVEKDQPPPVDASKEYRAFIAQEYEHPETKDIVLAKDIDRNAELDEALELYHKVDVWIKDLTEKRSLFQNLIAQALGSRYALKDGRNKFTFYSEKGRTSYSKVFAELKKKYNIPDSEIERLQDMFRGQPTRKFKFTRSKK